MLEHRVKIVCDHGLDQILTEEKIKSLNKNLVSEIRKNRLTEGLISTIEEIGHTMRTHLPLEKGDLNINEIANSQLSHKLGNSNEDDQN